MAGLNMTGNFRYLGEVIESYTGGINNDSSNNNIIENVNTMGQNIAGFGFQYFNDSAKREQAPIWNFVPSESGPITNTTNQYFWALAFVVSVQRDTRHTTKKSNPWAKLNLVGGLDGVPEGIMSCETNITEIVRLA